MMALNSFPEPVNMSPITYGKCFCKYKCKGLTTMGTTDEINESDLLKIQYVTKKELNHIFCYLVELNLFCIVCGVVFIDVHYWFRYHCRISFLV